MKKVLLFTSILLTSSVHAAFSQPGRITEIYSDGNWVMVEIANPVKENPSRCNVPSHYGLNLRTEADITLMKMLISAKETQSAVSFWNSADAEAELPLDVLDDIEGEAKEIYGHGNGWFAYTPALHMVRESGCAARASHPLPSLA